MKNERSALILTLSVAEGEGSQQAYGSNIIIH